MISMTSPPNENIKYVCIDADNEQEIVTVDQKRGKTHKQKNYPGFCTLKYVSCFSCLLAPVFFVAVA